PAGFMENDETLQAAAARETREEALKNVTEAIQVWLESAQDLGMEIPERETVSIEAA
ncbi:MAG: NUDIX domain-containing protein, partial [Chloroflexi bacterium]|nr:NUDIX domain-containing protein [Chloroflexota bacterium]